MFDGVLWIITFLSTVLLDVDLGLIIGVIFSFLIVLLRSSVPSVDVLQRDSDSQVWLDREKYQINSDSKYLIVQVLSIFIKQIGTFLGYSVRWNM